jgi:hypothetical protein
LAFSSLPTNDEGAKKFKHVEEGKKVEITSSLPTKMRRQNDQESGEKKLAADKEEETKLSKQLKKERQ